MRSKMMWLSIVLIPLLLTSCGPKPPDTDQVRKIVGTYLQEKIPSMVRIESLEITDIEKKSESCTVYFRGVYIPTKSSKGHILRKTIGAMSKQSDYLDKRLLSIEDEATIEAFMILTYENGTWSLSKHVPSILIPNKSGEE
jgi:hypothetical protein